MQTIFNKENVTACMKGLNIKHKNNFFVRVFFL